MARRIIDIDIPDLDGKLAVVTGASDGIGFHIAARLARAGCDLVLPVRDSRKGAAMAQRIREQVAGANPSVRELDLASLASIAVFTDTLIREGRPVDILINNAGVMTPPKRRLTVDHFELQFGTNHIGAYALTAGLLPLLTAGGAHVTTQLSMAADFYSVNWEDLNWDRRYNANRAYSSSKIAAGLFALELQRRSDAAGWGIRSNVSQPGVAPTNLLAAQPQMDRTDDTLAVKIVRSLSKRGVLLGTPQTAALPALFAATNPSAEGGRLYGPAGFLRLGGPPAPQKMYSRLTNVDDAVRIWNLSQELTGVTVPV